MTATADVDRAAPVLACEYVTVRFGGVVALSSVDFSVPQHSVVGLIGPNGAGKSTLFDVLSGLRRPAEGTVTMAGRKVTGLSPQVRSRLGLYRTFQHPELFPTMSVREHLVIAYRVRHSKGRAMTDLLGLPNRWRRDRAEEERIDEIMRMLGIADVAERRAAGLPLGLLRRVEVGRALAGDPSVILLDEPSSGLDTIETAILASAIRRTTDEKGIACVLVEHDVDLVLGLADRVHVLDFGQMIATGTPEEIRENPKVQAAYIGTEVTA